MMPHNLRALQDDLTRVENQLQQAEAEKEQGVARLGAAKKHVTYLDQEISLHKEGIARLRKELEETLPTDDFEVGATFLAIGPLKGDLSVVTKISKTLFTISDSGQDKWTWSEVLDEFYGINGVEFGLITGMTQFELTP